MLSQLAPYLPPTLVRLLLDEPDSPLVPRFGRHNGAAIHVELGDLIDRSGVLHLARVGTPDAVTEALNPVLTRIIAAIEAEGGEVLRCGPACLQAIFVSTTQSSTSLSELCQRAMQAARGLAQEFAGDTEIPLRVGIAAGELDFYRVGGAYNRWHFIVTGPALLRAANALGDTLGFLCISNEILGLLPSRAVSPQPRPQPSYSSVENQAWLLERMRLFLPRPVVDFSQHGLREWFAVCRPLTVLQIGIRGLTTGEDALEPLHQLIRTVQQVLVECEGTLLSSTSPAVLTHGSTPEEMLVLEAVFGLPPLGREDDPLQAIACALRLSQEFAAETWQEASLRGVFGIASGRLFAGPIGSPTLSVYTPIGEAVQTAHALIGRASDGETLCDDETHRLVRGQVACDVLPPREGPDASTHNAYRPYGELRTRQRTSGRLVGRMAERALLSEQLGQLQNGGPGGVVLIEGEQGIGKSRLLDDLTRQAQHAGLFVLSGAGETLHRDTPYFAFVPIICELLGIDPAARPEGFRACAQRRLEDMASHYGDRYPDLHQHAALLNDIFPIGLATTRHTQLLRGEARAACTREFLIHLLQWGMSRGIGGSLADVAETTREKSHGLLVIDDCQWLDSLAWALIRSVIRSVKPLLTVLALAPGEEPRPFVREIEQLPTTTLLRLRGLAVHEAADVVCQHLGASALPPPLRKVVAEQTDGHPLLSEALADAICTEGLVTVDAGTCAVHSDLSRTLVPRDTRVALARVIGQLDPGQRDILQTASVLGSTFELEHVRDIHPEISQRSEVASQLAALAARNIAPMIRPEPHQTHRFHHELTRCIAYERLDPKRRQALHIQAGELLERIHADTPGHGLALLAHHWHAAGNIWKYIDYRERCGTQLLLFGAFAEARRAFAELTELTHGFDQTPVDISRTRRARWQWQLGRALHGLGEFALAKNHYARALTLVGRPLPPVARIGNTSLLRQVVIQLKNRALQRRPARVRGNREQLETASWVYRELLDLSRDHGTAESAPYCALSLHNLADQLGSAPDLHAHALFHLSHVAAVAGLSDLSVQYATRAQALRATIGEHPCDDKLVAALAQFHAGHGYWDDAESLLDTALTRHPFGATATFHRLLATRVFLDLLRGRLAAAQIHIERQQRIQRRHPTRAGNGWSAYWDIWSRLSNGDVSGAQYALDRARSRIAGQHPAWDLRFCACAATLALRADQLFHARECVTRGLDHTSYVRPLEFLSLTSHLEFCRVAISLWEREPSRANRGLARQACKHLRRLARIFPISLPMSWLWRGIYNWKAGHPTRARRAWQQALERATHLEMHHTMAQIDFEVGRRIGAEAGRTQLKRAYARFKTIGAEDELLQVHSLLVDADAI